MTEEILQRIEQLLLMQKHILQIISALENRMKSPEVKWYDSTDVKNVLQISDSTLFRLRKTNTISAVKISGKWYYKIPDFEKILSLTKAEGFPHPG